MIKQNWIIHLLVIDMKLNYTQCVFIACLVLRAKIGVRNANEEMKKRSQSKGSQEHNEGNL